MIHYARLCYNGSPSMPQVLRTPHRKQRGTCPLPSAPPAAPGGRDCNIRLATAPGPDGQLKNYSLDYSVQSNGRAILKATTLSFTQAQIQANSEWGGRGVKPCLGL